MARILHILPDSALDPRQRFLGSTKDYRCRTEYFQARGIDAEELIVPGRSDGWLSRTLRARELDDFDAIFLEHTLYRRTVRYLGQRGRPRLLVRSINAEFYHHAHYAAACSRGLRDVRQAYAEVRLAFKRLRQDVACARQADALLCISAWDASRYYRWLTPRARLVTAPYFLPRSYESEIPDVRPKRDRCVCLMSTTPGTLPLLADSARSLSSLVEQSGASTAEWEFSITGEEPAVDLGWSDRIRPTGFLASPFEALVEARAVALLSDYGFGFKTKILDAICCGCWVLLTGGLYRRLPAEVKSCCLVVDAKSVESFTDALARTRTPPPWEKVNDRLRQSAFAALDGTLLDAAR